MTDFSVLVYGADGGLGTAITEEGRARGWDMVPVVREDVDLAQEGAAEEHIASLWEQRGPFDGVVYAAGVYPAARLLDPAPLPFERVFAINTRAFLDVARTASRLAVESGTSLSIVALSSGAASNTRPGTAIYAASKAALEALVRGIALEGAPHSIRCNAVAPGYVSVSSKLNPIPASYESALLEGSATGRLAQADDIAPAVVWLLSDDARWITGQSLIVDGGASLGSLKAPNWLADE